MTSVHHLIIGQYKTIEALAANWRETKVRTYRQGFAGLYLNWGWISDLMELQNDERETSKGEFTRLFPAVESLLLDHSQRDSLAYLEFTFEGFISQQKAILFRHQQIALGPLSTQSHWNTEGQLRHTPDGETAVNQVLKELGAYRSPKHDEFTCVGLLPR